MFFSLWSIGSAVSPAPTSPSSDSATPTTVRVVDTVPQTAQDAELAQQTPVLGTLDYLADPYHSDQLACEQGGCPARATVTRQQVNTRTIDVKRPIGAEAWRSLASAYFGPDDVERALVVIACESNGDPDAKNPHSTASGLFQHLTRYWPQRAEAAGFAGASVFDPEANVAVAAWLVYSGGGWNHWAASAGCWR
jgi:hypothetical protein